MSFDVTVRHQPRFVRVTIVGRPAFEELVTLIHLLGVESETWPQARALVDLRGVSTPFSHLQQHSIGVAAAASLSHMDRIASVVPPERLTRVSERAAQRDGTNVRVFDGEEAALAWLREAAVTRVEAPRLRRGSGSHG